MASESFTKEFAITKQSTFDRLEKAIENIEPMTVTNRDVCTTLKRNNERLLNIIRSNKSKFVSSEDAQSLNNNFEDLEKEIYSNIK